MLKSIVGFIGWSLLGALVGAGLIFGYKWLTTQPNIEKGDYGAYYTQAQSDVILFSTSWCQFCKKTRQLFEEKGVSFKDYNIENSAEAKTLYDQLNGKGVPVILIGDTRINGFRESTIVDSLQINSLLP